MTDADDEEAPQERYSNIEAEQSFLGCIMFDETVIDRLAVQIEPLHFYEPFHQRIFAVIKAEQKEGRAVEPALISHKFIGDKAYADLGGIRYLADLVDRAPPSNTANDYARLILQHWQMRELSSTWTSLNYITDPGEIITELRKQLTRVDAYEEQGDDFEELATIAERRIEELNGYVNDGRTPGLKTGLRCVDRLGGLMQSTALIIGARPSMGKTALARSIMDGCARRNPNHDIAFFSIEMTKSQSIDRALSAASVKAADLMTRPEAYRDFKRPNADMISTLAGIRHELPRNILISSRGRVSVDAVRRGCSRLVARRKRPLAAIVIDYLQIMEIIPERGESTASATAKVTAELKRIAKDFNCCVILLSQLSRQVESREDKRPVLADLRDSGSIEQDADYVLFPYRPHYYMVREGRKKSDAEGEFEDRLAACEHQMLVGIAKARDDALGEVEMFCDMAHDTVRNL